MKKLKKLIKRTVITVLAMGILIPQCAFAYDPENLPETMTLAEAMSISDKSEISYATVSDVSDECFVELTDEQIGEFYEKTADMVLHRTENPTPFRGTAINLYTPNGIMSYYSSSGFQLGKYGDNNYICYKAEGADDLYMAIVDSIYQSAPTKYPGESIHVNTAYDFLKLPSQEWAIWYAQGAAEKSLLPYELTSYWGNYISREQFCKLLGRLITVAEGYPDLETYVQKTKGAYLKNTFSDCVGRDEAIDMLYSLGVVNGKSDTVFDPDGMLSREEAATLITRAASVLCYVGTASQKTKFQDEYKISDWAQFAVIWVSEKNIMTGTSDYTFDPNLGYTVEQAVTTINRLHEYVDTL